MTGWCRSVVSTIFGRVELALHEQVARKQPAKLAAHECVIKGNSLSWNDAEGSQ